MLVPVRPAMDSSALRFSTLAPVASDKSFSASRPSTVALTHRVMTDTENAAVMAPPAATSALFAPEKARCMRSACRSARSPALSSPACRLASLASRSMLSFASAMGSAFFGGAGPVQLDDRQAVQEHLEIRHAQHLGHQRQPGPVEPAHAVCEQRIGAAGRDVVGACGRRFLAFPLDAGRMVEQVLQFPETVSAAAARASVAAP